MIISLLIGYITAMLPIWDWNTRLELFAGTMVLSITSSAWYVYSSGGVYNNTASTAYRPASLMFIGAAPSDAISAPTDAENTQEENTQEAVA